MIASTILIAVLIGVLFVPIWLGLGLPLGAVREHPRPITEPGRLIDRGQIMDPDRLDRAVD